MFNLSCQKCKIKKHRRSIKKQFYRGVNPPDFLEELEWGILFTFFLTYVLRLRSGREHWALRSGRERWAQMVAVEVQQGTLDVAARCGGEGGAGGGGGGREEEEEMRLT